MSSLMPILTYLKKNYVVAGSGLIVLVCLVVFYVRNDQIRRLSADYDDLNVRRTRILKNMKFGVGLENDVAQMKEMLAEAESRLFDPNDLAGNQRYFYQIERASGATISNLQQIIKQAPMGKQNVKERKRMAKSKYQEIVYDMNVRGTYEQVLSFFREVEGGEAFACTNGFSVTPSRGGGEAQVNMRFSVEVLGRKS